MSINVFEGARRFAKLVALLWVVGFGSGIISDISTNIMQPEQPSELQHVLSRKEWLAAGKPTKQELQQNAMSRAEEWRQKRWEEIGISTLQLLGGVAFIWALTWAIGWIVRGFLGIPSSQDFKP